MSKPTIEELAAAACDRISYQVHCEESENMKDSEITISRAEAEDALIALIRAVVEEMRPEPSDVVMQRAVFDAINRARNPK